YGFRLHQPRFANTFGRHCSMELYWQSQYMVLLSIVITAHQGACAVAGGGPKNTPARGTMAAKINRVIVSLHAPNNTERQSVFAANIISRRRNVRFTPESGHLSVQMRKSASQPRRRRFSWLGSRDG